MTRYQAAPMIVTKPLGDCFEMLFFPNLSRIYVDGVWLHEALKNLNNPLSLTDLESALISETGKRFRKNLAQELIELGAIVCEDVYQDWAQRLQVWSENGWMAALIFHIETAEPKFFDEFGETRRENARVGSRNIISQCKPPKFFKKVDASLRISTIRNHNFTPPSLNETILRRRSGATSRTGRVCLSAVSHILERANNGVCERRSHAEENIHEFPELLLDSSFCALETYIYCKNMSDVEPGLYHYNIAGHSLDKMTKTLEPEDLVRACIGQSEIGNASAVILLSVVWERYMYRYRHSRAYRTVLVDVAESAQNLLLLATEQGFSTFLTPALNESLTAEILGESIFQEQIFYAIGIG